MHADHESTSEARASRMRSVSDTRLHGHWLTFARITWLMVAGLALGLFFAGLQLRFHQLVLLSHQAEKALQLSSPAGESPLLQWILSANIYPVIVLTLELVLMGGLALSALILFWRRSDNWMALFLSLNWITAGTFITRSVDALMTTYPLWQFPASFVMALGVEGYLLAYYLFPDGRFVPSWTCLLAVISTVWALSGMFFPGAPFNLAHLYTLPPLWFLVLVVWMIPSIVVQVYRYVHVSRPAERRQTKWIVIFVSSTVLWYAAYYLPRVFFHPLSQPGVAKVLYDVVGVPLFLASLLLLPVFFLFSLLSCRLYDIDILINRTLVYTTLTATLALIYVGLVIGLQALLRGIISQENSVAIVISTLAIAALFQPLRRRIQRVIDRRFYRRKYDAARTLAAFSTTLRNEIDLNHLREELLAIVQETMQPSHVSLWLRKSENERKPNTLL